MFNGVLGEIIQTDEKRVKERTKYEGLLIKKHNHMIH